MRHKTISSKMQALLSLEAMLIDYSGSYGPQEHLHYLFSQLEKVKHSSQPWALMDREQHQTFQSLVVQQLGGERRSGKDRRQGRQPVDGERRVKDRRWTPPAKNR